MELRNLRVFAEVVRCGGFTEAAKFVFATQSTVSKSVKALEEALGVRLLDRSGAKTTPTAAGEIVYRRALQMMAVRDDMVAELDELRGLKRGRLRIGLPPVGSDVLFASVFAAYRGAYPGVEIVLVEGGSRHLEDVLRAGDVEIAALLQPVPDEFEHAPLWREPIVALCPPAHPLAGRSGVDLLALSDTPFILFDAAFTMHDIVLRACARRGFAPKIAAESSQISFMVRLAAAGLGITFLPRLVAEPHAHHGAGTIGLSDPSMFWDLSLAWRRGAFVSRAAAAWVALATEQISQAAASDTGATRSRDALADGNGRAILSSLQIP